MSASPGFPRTHRSSKARRHFGARNDTLKDQVYLHRHGFIYTSPWLVTPPTTRCSASVLLTASGAPFELTANGATRRYRALAIRPLVERSLRAEDIELVSVQINPFHPLFRRFSAIPGPGCLSLERAHFAALDDALEAAYRGTLPATDGAALFERIVALAGECLPEVKPADARIERVLEMLQLDATRPLTELAAAVGLSYDRMSHLFAEVVGLRLRSYLVWLKVRAAASFFGSGMTLTQIALAAGFNDSAHLCNTWQQTFGASPSHFLNESFVVLHSAEPITQCYGTPPLPGWVSTAAVAGDTPCDHGGSPLETPGSSFRRSCGW